MARCYNFDMAQREQSPEILHADPEHSGLLLAVIGILLLGLVLSFVLFQLLFRLVAANSDLIDFATLLSCVGSIILAMLLAWIGERYLKGVWHSGTMLILGESQLEFKEGNASVNDEGEPLDITFDWAKNVNVTRWYFKLDGYPRAGRERRVAGNWSCLACQIQQDEEYLVLFSYFPPKETEIWAQNAQLAEPFHRISMVHLYNEAGKKRRGAPIRPPIPSHMLTDKDGRYWLAEKKRWLEGIELTKTDFSTLMAYIEQHI